MYGKVLCIYHSADLDGYGSAAIVKHFFSKNKKGWQVDLRGYNYGGNIPQVYDYDQIIVVDVSFPMSTFKEWVGLGKEIIWIDHHKHAIDEYGRYGEIDGLTVSLSTKLAAIELTWNFFMKDEMIPDVVKYLGIYDSWRNSDKKLWEKVILPFQYGMRSICNSPDQFPVCLIDDSSSECKVTVEELINKGKTILSYQRAVDKTLMRRAFKIEFEGYKTLAVNASGVNSLTFKAHKQYNRFQLYMAFNYNYKSGKFAVTIFSDNKLIDAGEIAKRYGGGGHKGAAGFLIETEELLEIFKEQREKIFY